MIPVRQRFVTVDPLQDLTDPLQWNRESPGEWWGFGVRRGLTV